MRFLTISLGTSLAFVPSLVVAQTAHPAKIGTSKQGDFLQTTENKALYVYDKDDVGSGKSSCDMTCAKNWPPFKANTGDKPSGDWSMIKRADGSEQWTYKGRPLYTFVRDKSGEMAGNSFEGNSWHIAKP